MFSPYSHTRSARMLVRVGLHHDYSLRSYGLFAKSQTRILASLVCSSPYYDLFITTRILASLACSYQDSLFVITRILASLVCSSPYYDLFVTTRILASLACSYVFDFLITTRFARIHLIYWQKLAYSLRSYARMHVERG